MTSWNMLHWKTICSVCLAAPMLYGLASAQAAPKAKPMTPYAALPAPDEEKTNNLYASLALCKQGDASAQRLAWKQAQQEYQQALDLWPENPDALYGLAQCSQIAGDQAKAVVCYRKAVYSDNPADKGFGETHTNRLMEFVLLLNKTGQVAEALFVYNHAAAALDYEGGDVQHGKQNLKVLLPEVVVDRTLGDQVQYTPEHLQALADTALAHEETSFGRDKEALAHTQEAVKLFPDSAVTHYYLGETLRGINDSGAKAAFEKAVQLSDNPATQAAAKERVTQSR